MGHMQTQPSLNFEHGCPKVSGDLGKTVPPFLARCFESATSENFAVGNRKSTCGIHQEGDEISDGGLGIVAQNLGFGAWKAPCIIEVGHLG